MSNIIEPFRPNALVRDWVTADGERALQLTTPMGLPIATILCANTEASAGWLLAVLVSEIKKTAEYQAEMRTEL